MVIWLIPVLIGGLLAVIGIGLLAFAMIQRNRARVTGKWPTAPAVILSSRVETQTSREYDDGQSVTRTTHKPLVEYAYEVDGKSHQGTRIFPGAGMSFDLGTAQGIVNRYPPGAPVIAHYNPVDPSQAVLETEPKGQNVLMIVGIVFAVIGALACCIGGGLALLA